MIGGGGGLISAGLKKYRKIIISLSDMWSRRTDQTQCFYLSAWCLYVCAIFLITLIRPMWDDNPALDF